MSLAPAASALILEEWPDRNVKLTVELSHVRASTGDEPDRLVVTGQSFGGYEPIGMLARLMKPIIDKAKMRQAGDRGARARVLVCDVSDTVVVAHLQEESGLAISGPRFEGARSGDGQSARGVTSGRCANGRAFPHSSAPGANGPEQRMCRARPAGRSCSRR
jgi:hypothetical protein